MHPSKQTGNTQALCFNPFDPVWRADPYPLYQRLREEAPIGHVAGLDIWYFSRYADCLALLRDPRTGSDTRKSEIYQRLISSGWLRMPGSLRAQRSFLLLDPPDHTRLRSLVASAFTPVMIDRLRPRIEQLTIEFLDAAVSRRGRLEIVDDLAYPLPFTIICELLGLPRRDQTRFRRWSEPLVRSVDPQLNPSPALVQEQTEAIIHATGYLTELMNERRREPRDDLLTALFRAEAGGDRLTDEELLSTVIMLFAGGQETTVNLISNTVFALLSHPDQYALLRKQPSLVRAAIEEVLRWDPPTQMTQRIALEEMTIGDIIMRKGDPMILLLAAANRDLEKFPDAEKFDISRPQSPHLAFGSGPHFCLGAPLARLETEVVITTLLKKFPSLRLGEGVVRRDTLVMRGFSSLPVAIQQGARTVYVERLTG